MIPILSGNVASALPSGYDVANSCRFVSASSSYMHKTPGSAGNLRTWTFSAWVKKCTNGVNNYLLSSYVDANNTVNVWFNDEDYLECQVKASGNNYKFSTNRKFRDVSAWLHVVYAVDTTESTAGDRVKIWINGTRETSFSSSTNPALNTDSVLNDTTQMNIGKYDSGTTYFDGYMAEVCLVDGSQLAATSFGEFDEDSPTIWKPIDVSGLTFGTNGFYLDFEDSSNLGNDANGGTDLTEVNMDTYDFTIDTPTNNFATFNSLMRFHSSMSIAEGNLKVTTGNAYASYGSNSFFSTIGMSAGKWYCEIKVLTAPNNNGLIGVAFDLENFHQQGSDGNAYNLSYTTKGYSYSGVGGIGNDGGGWGVTGQSTWGVNDIISIALDMDNHKVYFAKNGTWQNSGDPTSGATGTGAVSIASGYTYFFGVSDNQGSTVWVYSGNFGNPLYGITSTNADANGYGNFEYAVPSGYYSLCTKNLAEYG